MCFVVLGGMAGAALGQKPAEPPPAEKPVEAAPATAPPAPRVEPRAYDLRTTKRLTGEWGGVRTALEDKGVSLRLFYNQQFQQNLRGGLDTHNGHRLSGSYDLHLLLDFGKMKLLDNAGFFMETKGTWSDGINPNKVGALLNVNADAGDDHAIFVKKWWYWQKFFQNKLEIRLGLLETNKNLFDVSAYVNNEDVDFINRGSIRNATVPHRAGIGAFAKYSPWEWLYVQAAVIDAQSRDRRTGFDTAFHDEDRYNTYFEAGVTPKWRSAKGPMSGNVRIGLWYDANARTVFRDTLGGRRESETRTGEVGYYLGAEQLVWKETSDEKDAQGLALFARYGHAHQDAARISDYWSAGASYKGLIRTRDQDVFAMAVSQAILSERYRNEVHPRADRETVYEWYYAYQATPWCVVAPHVQVVTNPGGDKDDRDALVAGVRVRLTF